MLDLFDAGGLEIFSRGLLGDITGKYDGQATLYGDFAVKSSLTITGLGSVGTPTVTNVGATGATTYGYKVVATVAGLLTAASSEGTTTTGNATLTGSNYNRVVWARVSGATGYRVYRSTGGTTPPMLIATITSGVTLQYDDTDNTSGSAQTPSTTDKTARITLSDYAVHAWGTDGDVMSLLHSGTLAANTADAYGALVGTPVSQALAANSFIISNITANGDVAFYANLAGNSQQWLFYDTSASQLSLLMGKLKYSAGAFAFQESTTISSTGTLTINPFTLGGNITAGNNNIGGGLVSSEWNLDGANGAGGSGVRVSLRGSDTANSFVLFTPNTAKNDHVLRLIISGNSDTAAVATWASITQTWSSYGAGTITADASGNLTSVSDERLKTSLKSLVYGLKEVLELKPIMFKWTKASGLETEHYYPGFGANQVFDIMPDATGMNPDGYRTLQDRGIVGALVNAVKELNSRLLALEV